MVNAGHARLLLADDNEAVRAAYTRLLERVDGVGSVVGAADGVEALQIAATDQVDIAILDLNMPRLDGIEAGTSLTMLRPTISVALHSSDPSALRKRARELDFTLFDTLDVDGLAWLTSELERRRRQRAMNAQDVSCSRCGYGVAVDPPPMRCPMCNRTADWTSVRTRTRDSSHVAVTLEAPAQLRRSVRASR